MAELFSKEVFISVVKGWQINPGANVIPVEKIELLKQDNFFSKKLRENRYQIRKTSSDTKKVDKSGIEGTDNQSLQIREIMNMSTSEAKKIIFGKDNNEGILDLWLLKELQTKDQRTGIQSAVEKQLKTLYEREEG